MAARYGGREAEDCLRFAVACGAESTQHFGAGVLEQREVERLVPDVRVEQLETPRASRVRVSVGTLAVRPPANLGSSNGS